MNFKSVMTAMAVAAMLFSLSACANPQAPAQTEPSELPTEQTHATIPAEEAPWQKNFADELLEKYGVLPEYYEDLWDGTYLVYVEVGGEILPFAIFDAVTEEYSLITAEGD